MQHIYIYIYVYMYVYKYMYKQHGTRYSAHLPPASGSKLRIQAGTAGAATCASISRTPSLLEAQLGGIHPKMRASHQMCSGIPWQKKKTSILARLGFFLWGTPNSQKPENKKGEHRTMQRIGQADIRTHLWLGLSLTLRFPSV